jgi:hypothetical protein
MYKSTVWMFVWIDGFTVCMYVVSIYCKYVCMYICMYVCGKYILYIYVCLYVCRFICMYVYEGNEGAT